MTHAVLHKALGQAVKWNMIVRNVSDAVEKPKTSRKTMQVLDADGVTKLLQAASDDRLHALYVIAVATGLRQGELLGLHCEDVDLNNAALTVRRALSEDAGVFRLGEPKTSKGRRRVDLPEFAVVALREHRKRMLAEGTPRPWVFCDTTGNPLRKSNLIRRSFKPLLKKAGLPDIRFHDLRHTAATKMAEAGVSESTMLALMGHMSRAMLERYSHVRMAAKRSAVEALSLTTLAVTADSSTPHAQPGALCPAVANRTI